MASLRMIRSYKWPQNAYTADLIRFVPHFKELRLSWTANAAMSEGLEKFVDEYLPKIRANNPDISYRLHRSYVDCHPFVVGLFNWERKKKYRVCWKHENHILACVEQLSLGGDYRPGIKNGVTSRLPRGQELWDIETRGHDVFKVFSKYKGDPPDPNEMRSIQHPHVKYQPMLCKKYHSETEIFAE